MTIPINLHTPHVGTVAFWRSAAPHFGARKWRGAMDRYAMQHGKAIALLGNDGARIVERLADGSLVRHDLAPDEVQWHHGWR